MKPLSRYSTTQHLDTTGYGTHPADRHETHCATSGAASFIAAAATYLLQSNASSLRHLLRSDVKEIEE
jgi:hypothetical protein